VAFFPGFQILEVQILGEFSGLPNFLTESTIISEARFEAEDDFDIKNGLVQ
jgi:hypothetical protein